MRGTARPTTLMSPGGRRTTCARLLRDPRPTRTTSAVVVVDAALPVSTTRRRARVCDVVRLRPLVTIVTLLRGGDTECRGRARPTAVPLFGRPVRGALL